MQEISKTTKGSKYYIVEKDSILGENLFENIRKRLKLTKKQLPDNVIKKVLKLNSKLIAEWILNHPDGFKIKDNGVIAVSKWLPKCLRGDKEQKIEEILNNPKNDEYMKEMFIKRYKKSIEYYKTFQPNKKYHINLHSFFYIYRIIWFNSRNCAFRKAELYELKPSAKLKKMLNEKIIQGKDYFEYQFSDFRIRKRDKILSDDEKIHKQMVKRLYSRKKSCYKNTENE